VTARELILAAFAGGAGFAAAQIVVNWAIINLTMLISQFNLNVKYRALGVPDSVILEHGSRLERRGPFYACRPRCIICEDLGLTTRDALDPGP
jgi:hypothetical protein